MEKPIGQIIREVLEKSGIKLTVFAERIGTSRQNVYKIFEKDSISTKRLMRISLVLEYDFFQHFRLAGDGKSQVSPDISYRPARQRLGAVQLELNAAQERILILQERLRDKEEIIELLRSDRPS